MPKYWIGSVTPENYEIIQEQNIWGVNIRFKQTLQRTSENDAVVFYIHGKKLGGIFKIASELYHKPGVFKGGTYPYLIDLKPVHVPGSEISQHPVFTKELRSKLDFIKNEQYWSIYFRRPMLEITERDFNRLKNEVKEKLA